MLKKFHEEIFEMIARTKDKNNHPRITEISDNGIITRPSSGPIVIELGSKSSKAASTSKSDRGENKFKVIHDFMFSCNS